MVGWRGNRGDGGGVVFEFIGGFYFAESFFIESKSSGGVSAWTDRPTVSFVIVDVFKQEIDCFFYSFCLKLFVPDGEHQPLEHVSGSLYFAFVFWFVSAAFVPVGAEASVWVLKFPCVVDKFIDKFCGA